MKHPADGITMPSNWAGAVCAQVDPELFFPEGGSAKDAKSLCAVCPVRIRCLQYALDHNEIYGVYGGTSPRERRALRRQRLTKEIAA